MTHQDLGKRTPAPTVNHSRDVLIVDDNDGIRKIMRFALEDAGYSVYEACNGIEALDYLRTHAKRLVVVLDLNLPGLDGWSVLRAIADTPLAKRHRFVLATAQCGSLPSALIKLLSHLRVPVIAKPCSLDRILDAVAGHAPMCTIADGYTTVSPP